MSFDSLLEPVSYIDVDDVVSHEPIWWIGNMDRKFASWSEDVVGHMSSVLVVE